MGHPLTISSDEQVPIFHLSIPLAKIACSTKLADGMELHGPNAILFWWSVRKGSMILAKESNIVTIVIDNQ